MLGWLGLTAGKPQSRGQRRLGPTPQLEFPPLRLGHQPPSVLPFRSRGDPCIQRSWVSILNLMFGCLDRDWNALHTV